MASSNGKRTSRKRTFAEEEIWYLVQFEDQPDTFRVLNEREVKHLDPEDEDEMNEGETVLAFWSADKQFYKAQIIKISDDKSELLKERRQLETSLKKSALGKAMASDQTVKKKPTASKKAQKKAKVSSEEETRKEAKKAKEAEKIRAEKIKSAEIRAKVVQATKRISTQNKDLPAQGPHETSAVPVCHLEAPTTVHPLSLPAFRRTGPAVARQKSTTHVCNSVPAFQTQHQVPHPHPLSLPAFRNDPKISDPASSSSHEPTGLSYKDQVDDSGDDQHIPTDKASKSKKKKSGKIRKDKTLQQQKEKNISLTRTTKQVTQTHIVSDDEADIDETALLTTSCGNLDCKALLLENKNLKDKVRKLQKRLDIAVKAKSPSSIMAGKPAAGIVDRELAAEYQMKEFYDGSGIFWYSTQRSICTACTKWEEYVNLVVDIFFPKEVLRHSCARGLKKGRKLDGTVPLCQPIVDAIIGKVCARFQPPPSVAQITGKINQKCTEARRPKRVYVPQ